MQTTKTISDWADFVVGTFVHLLIASIPTMVAGILWFFIPKTFGCIVLAVLVSMILSLVQFSWFVAVLLSWDLTYRVLPEARS